MSLSVNNAVQELPIPRPFTSLFKLEVKQNSALRFVYSKSVTLPSGVARTFSEFSFLRQALITENTGSMIPRLPSRSPAGLFTLNVTSDDDVEQSKGEPLEASVLDDLALWLNYLQLMPIVSESETLKKFLENSSFTAVKKAALASWQDSFDAKKVALPPLSRTDKMRLFVNQIVREFKLSEAGSGSPAANSAVPASTEESLANHKRLSSHMLSHAKLLLANATQATNHRIDLAECERKLAANVLTIVHKTAEPMDAPANIALQSAATTFSSRQSAASTSDRKLAAQSEQQLAFLRLWLNIAQGYADAVERLSNARDNAHFLEPLLIKVSAANTSNSTANAATSRTEALDLHLKLECEHANAIARALDAAKENLLEQRAQLLAQWMN